MLYYVDVHVLVFSQPVSRSASQLPQMVLRHPLKASLDKPDKQVEQPAAPAMSKSMLLDSTTKPATLEKADKSSKPSMPEKSTKPAASVTQKPNEPEHSTSGTSEAIVPEEKRKMSVDEKCGEEGEIEEIMMDKSVEEREGAPVIAVGRVSGDHS